MNRHKYDGKWSDFNYGKEVAQTFLACQKRGTLVFPFGLVSGIMLTRMKMSVQFLKIEEKAKKQRDSSLCWWFEMAINTFGSIVPT